MVDVLIIGAGAAGGVAALELQGAGLSVVALEQGGWHSHENFRGSEWDWELGALGPWSAQPSARLSPDDYPIDVTTSDMGALNFNGVGGGTILYNAVWPRFLPSYFRERSQRGLADDWPWLRARGFTVCWALAPTWWTLCYAHSIAQLPIHTHLLDRMRRRGWPF